ncbi:MAG: response regulator [Phormidesmis sp.]
MEASQTDLETGTDNKKTPFTFLVVDDHAAIVECVTARLQRAYPEAQLLSARDCSTARQMIEQYALDLVILDLDLPEVLGETAQFSAGIELLSTLLIKRNPAVSIGVLSASVRPLVRLKPEIDRYPAGLVAVDKTQPLAVVLKMVELALRKSIYLPPEVRSQPQFNPPWLSVLMLKFQIGLSDKAIAEHMGVSPRTIRSYWLYIQDALGVYDNPNEDIRVKIEQAARLEGLID